MQRSSFVIMIVLLCYVTVLNFVVVGFLYRQFEPALASRRAASSTVRRAADAVHDMVGAAPEASLAPGLAAAGGARAPACDPTPFTDVAVRVQGLVTSVSNDAALSPAVRLLGELRLRVLASAKTRVRVWLVLRPADFVALLRLWCVALGVDTRGRCQCEVLFSEPAQHLAIARLVAHREPCLERLFLLDEGFRLPPRVSFSAEVLARAGPEGSRLQVLAAPEEAPAPAGRESLLLPGCFLRECVLRRCRLAPGLENDADIASFAEGARAGLVCRV
jgi:hypothetical protein